MRFLEQGLQPILELHLIAGHLVLAAHHGAPKPLFGVGHETGPTTSGVVAAHRLRRRGLQNVSTTGGNREESRDGSERKADRRNRL